jgi:hypothetical protein
VDEPLFARWDLVLGAGAVQNDCDSLGFACRSVPVAVAGGLEFCLEGLHLTKRVNKHEARAGGWAFGGSG